MNPSAGVCRRRHGALLRAGGMDMDTFTVRWRSEWGLSVRGPHIPSSHSSFYCGSQQMMEVRELVPSLPATTTHKSVSVERRSGTRLWAPCPVGGTAERPHQPAVTPFAEQLHSPPWEGLLHPPRSSPVSGIWHVTLCCPHSGPGLHKSCGTDVMMLWHTEEQCCFNVFSIWMK